MPRVVIDDNHRSRQNVEDINVVTSLAIQVKLIFLTLGFPPMMKKQRLFYKVFGTSHIFAESLGYCKTKFEEFT